MLVNGLFIDFMANRYWLRNILGGAGLLKKNSYSFSYGVNKTKTTEVTIRDNIGIIVIFAQDGNTASTIKVALYLFAGAWAENGARYIKLVAEEGEIRTGSATGTFSVSYDSNSNIQVSYTYCGGNMMILSYR